MSDYSQYSNEELLKMYYEAEVKESINDNMQMGMKILLNGGYGAVGNAGFLYYKVENAESITMTGQLVNRYTCSRIEKFLQHMLKTEEPIWVYSDTDSGYFQLDPLVKELGITDKDQIVNIIDEFCKTVIAPEIDKISNNIANMLNSYEQRMFWNREIIAERAIWTSKKKYAAKVWNSEGVEYKEPKYKIMGLESKKSSTPAWARPALEEAYITCLNGTEQDIVDFFKRTKKKFNQMSIEDIAIPTGVNGLEEYYDPVTIFKARAQAHVKAALYHNKIIADRNIKTIAPIASGSKIKFVYLKQPNPLGFEVIGFEDWLPKEFGVEKYVDRDILFEKGFIKPLTIFLNAIGWDYEERINIEDFFV